MGATGPLLAPFFIREDFKKEEVVATKSACQIFVHLVKMPVFLSLAFPFSNYIWEISAMVVGVVIGTKLGTDLLKRMNSDMFLKIVKVIMFLVAIRLLLKVVGIV